MKISRFAFALIFLFLSCVSFQKEEVFFNKKRTLALVSLNGQQALPLRVNGLTVVSKKHASLNKTLEKFVAQKLLQRFGKWPALDLLPLERIAENPAYRAIKGDPFPASGHFSGGVMNKLSHMTPTRAQKLGKALPADLFVILEIRCLLSIRQVKGDKYGTTELEVAVMGYDPQGRLVWRDRAKDKGKTSFFMEGSLAFNLLPIQKSLKKNIVAIEKKFYTHFVKSGPK